MMREKEKEKERNYPGDILGPDSRRMNLVRHFGLKLPPRARQKSDLANSKSKAKEGERSGDGGDGTELIGDSDETTKASMDKSTAVKKKKTGSGSSRKSPVVLSFSISRIENMFELRVPRLQINGGHELELERERERVEREAHAGSSAFSSSSGATSRTTTTATTATTGIVPGWGGGIGEVKRKVLRREIKRWWEGVADHIDKLVRFALPLTHTRED
jgi:hypothetical protein